LIVPQFNTVTLATGIERLPGKVAIPKSPRPSRISPAQHLQMPPNNFNIVIYCLYRNIFAIFFWTIPTMTIYQISYDLWMLGGIRIMTPIGIDVENHRYILGLIDQRDARLEPKMD
jgi:hypothetical protein